MAPVISAGVITANIIWNATNAIGGIVPRRVVDVGQEREVEVADPAVGAAEGDREADDRPEHADETHREDVLHQHAEHVLRAHHAAVEEREAGGHEGHECCRGQHPGGVSCVHDGGTVDDRRFRACRPNVSGRCASSRGRRSPNADQHPAAAADGAHPARADGAPYTDDQRVTPAFAQVGDADGARQLGAAEDPAGVVGEDGVDRPLLRCQVLEGARDLRPRVGWHRRSGAIHEGIVRRQDFGDVGAS